MLTATSAEGSVRNTGTNSLHKRARHREKDRRELRASPPLLPSGTNKATGPHEANGPLFALPPASAEKPVVGTG